MHIGVSTEIKAGEHRVALMPDAVAELVRSGHTLWVQSGAGVGSGYSDEHYQNAGASIAGDAAELYAQSQLVVKVKEPQPDELGLLTERHLLFSYLHLAAGPDLTRALAATGATAIAYETITGEAGDLPLLTPMSEIAGRLSVQAGAFHLESTRGGRGVLLGGVPGVAAARVIIIGGGVVDFQAACMAEALGARVTVFDRSLPRLRHLDSLFRGRVSCEYASYDQIAASVAEADLVIGAVLLAGARAPRILSREDVASMPAGSVLVDVAIDQGGCFATSKATTHQQPTYTDSGVIHYCVANIPGGPLSKYRWRLAFSAFRDQGNVLQAYWLSVKKHSRRDRKALKAPKGAAKTSIRCVFLLDKGNQHSLRRTPCGLNVLDSRRHRLYLLRGPLVARTSTMALSHATLPYVMTLADKGLSACLDNSHIQAGINLYAGQVTHRAVADAVSVTYRPFTELYG